MSTGTTLLAALLAAAVWHVLAGIGETPADGAPEATGASASPRGLGTNSAGNEAEEDAQQRPTGQTALTDNPLYGTGRLSPLPCPVSDPAVGDPEAMEEFLNYVADCLDEAWQTQFRRAGLPYEPPGRVFWSEPGTSPCRDYPSNAGAFYCRASASIYIGTEDVVAKWHGEENEIVYASLLAHEYGHHVQNQAGILGYYHDRRGEEATQAARNAWTRRSELQANCLSGAFLGAVLVSYPLSAEDREVLIADARATADREGEEDERTHGNAENSVHWTDRGLAEQRPGACNTWGADTSLVQ